MSGPSSVKTEPYLSWWGLDGEQRRWPLSAEVMTIGRSTSADVIIEYDLLVSRVHTALERVGGAWMISDDGLSTNGTFVNGHRVVGHVHLHDRDEIRVGSTVLTFCAPGEPAGTHTLVGEPLPHAMRLTQAQRAVLIALCRPFRDNNHYSTPATNHQIADELCVSVDAVKTHLRVLFHKFGIDKLPQNQKRAQLAEMALEFGLVSPHDIDRGGSRAGGT